MNAIIQKMLTDKNARDAAATDPLTIAQNSFEVWN
jgi:hypothetical protein